MWRPPLGELTVNVSGRMPCFSSSASSDAPPTLPGLRSTSTAISLDFLSETPQLHPGYILYHFLICSGSLDARRKLSGKQGGYFSRRLIGNKYQFGCAFKQSSATSSVSAGIGI